MISKFRKKPIEVLALQYNTELDRQAIIDWAKEKVQAVLPNLIIYTLEGTLFLKPGDWLVQGIELEFYPVKDSIFKETYDKSPD